MADEVVVIADAGFGYNLGFDQAGDDIVHLYSYLV